MRDVQYRKKGERKKLSWIYKKKAKAKGKKRSGNRNDGAPQKKSRIIVRNLPFKATEEDVRKFYEKFGEIEEINLLKHPDGKPVGCGFIQFRRIQDASKAIFNTNKKEFLGRTISSSWAISKSKFCEKLEKALELKTEPKTEDDEYIDDSIVEEPVVEDPVLKDSVKEDNEEDTCMEGIKQEEEEEEGEEGEEQREIKRKTKKELPPEIKQQIRKLQKEKRRQKRARIIIRNLSFQATEEDLREHFSQYGQVQDIKILTRSDGKRIGCAFLQFSLVQSAAKAVHYANMQEIRGRAIVVDWAMPKNKFEKEQGVEENSVKEEVESVMDETVKEEVKEENEEAGSLKDDDCVNATESDSDIDEAGMSQVKRKTCAKTEEDDDTSQEIQSEEEDDEDEEDDEVDDDEEEEEDEIEMKRPKRESHDVIEGKTIFLKNVPFTVKNEELKQFMEQFGPVYYALVCIDSLTEHSKGTAFVKFRNLEDAEKCLAAGNELKLRDQIMEAHRALGREEVENKAAMKKYKEKDSRNLYLVKEGVVLAGSPAAAGVSAADMAKRLQLEQWKSQILRNLNMFVSRVRLVVYNLPPTMDDAKLRAIFERHSNSDAVIKEARVMRDLKNVDAKGVGKSKEYGFVSFTRHEDALKALRAINNNPTIFSNAKRPIVAFSIENRIMVNAKQRRIEKSREQNPLWHGNESKRRHDNENENETSAKRLKSQNFNPNLKTNNKKQQYSRRQENFSSEDTDVKPFTGMVGKPGENKMRSKFKLKTQAMVHHQSVKKEKKMNKSAKKLEAKRKQKEAAKQEVKPKQGSKINPDDVHFAKLVKNYKDKLQSVTSTRSKWYET